MSLENLKIISPEELIDKRLSGLEDTPKLGTAAMQERFDAHPDANTEAINQNARTQNLNNEKLISKDNNIPYTPTGDYNPATKKYVDDTVKLSGVITKEDIDRWNDELLHDKIIKNQDEWEEMLLSPVWNDAKRILLSCTVTASGDIIVPPNVRLIDFAPDAELIFTALSDDEKIFGNVQNIFCTLKNPNISIIAQSGFEGGYLQILNFNCIENLKLTASGFTQGTSLRTYELIKNCRNISAPQVTVFGDADANVKTRIFCDSSNISNAVADLFYSNSSTGEASVFFNCTNITSAKILRCSTGPSGGVLFACSGITAAMFSPDQNEKFKSCSNVLDSTPMFITGTYTGDGKFYSPTGPDNFGAGRMIELGFTPSCVILTHQGRFRDYVTGANGYKEFGGIAYPGSATKQGAIGFMIKESGFMVNGDMAPAGSPGNYTNLSGEVYNYIAFK